MVLEAFAQWVWLRGVQEEKRDILEQKNNAVVDSFASASEQAAVDTDLYIHRGEEDIC